MKQEQGLYRQQFEHDNCGIGAVVNKYGIKSHKIVEQALLIVERLEHRAGKDAKGETGDGVGILLQISHRFFKSICEKENIDIGEEGEYGIAVLFLPREKKAMELALHDFRRTLHMEGMELLGFRKLPVCADILGEAARACMPAMVHAFIKRPADTGKGFPFDRRLYAARRLFEKSHRETYVVSMSSRTIVYKGMFLVSQLRQFYEDLQSPEYESAIAMVHSRFSTNTNPAWKRAHPNRMLVHNGEINTIRGNVDKMLAREDAFASDKMKKELFKVLPAVEQGGSDSAMLDNALEFLVMNGMELPLAVRVMLPKPWEKSKKLSKERKAFYQYYAVMMEAWDGPASILFSDGDVVGAILDRNGLRPSRYYVTKSGDVIFSSEAGVLPIAEEEIVKKDRLQPGKLLLVDTLQHKIWEDEELEEHYMRQNPYGEWLDRQMAEVVEKEIESSEKSCQGEALVRLQKAFGYTSEDYWKTIFDMAQHGVEGTASMGADIPLSVLSEKHPSLFCYFRQLFAQVTNPPIDAIREEIHTSTTVYAGHAGNLLQVQPESCHVLKLEKPVLTNGELEKIKTAKGFHTAEASLLYEAGTGLSQAVEHLFEEVDTACREGAGILVLSDRGVDKTHLPIPSLLAVSAVQDHLAEKKKSMALSIVLESAEPREIHHFAALLGYGACAVNPYLVLDTIRELTEKGLLAKDYETAVFDYREGILGGIVRIASKMGISTLQSYQGARLFEAVGIAPEVTEKYFRGTISRIGGLTLADIEADIKWRHDSAFCQMAGGEALTLDNPGYHKRRQDGEHHRYNPQTIHLLQEAVRQGDYEMFLQYTRLADAEENGSLRNLLEIRYPQKGIPLSEVESGASIVKRFKTGAMSYGSISQEAHETIAIAMNRLHGKSNSGEGGESAERLQSKGSGTDSCSAVKQVASGRFGVTSRYLVSASEIQIKMAQGAKPGEGGHLPGKKVYPWIAETRHATPGVSLISPPPHHDIYSIEDLAELIYDLKNANRYAAVSVKLVSEAGVGTVASGVAKAGAETILISGCDGGTGAAYASSIHHAGLPWELGLSEAHQTLLKNGLRGKVRLEVDGKLMTGRDILIAALLGAEEFGFATAPLVTLGCVMMRVCNQDTCPVGIATQNPKLRKNFKGKPEYVIHLMQFLAEELRGYMARLGVRTVDELVGHTEWLQQKKFPAQTPKGRVSLDAVLSASFAGSGEKVAWDWQDAYDFKLEETKDAAILLKELKDAVKEGKPASLSVSVDNTDRAFGTLLGAEVTRQHEDGLKDDTIFISCRGTGGQSFGAFLPKGVTLSLCGESNDYVGKGLSGGKIAVYPPKEGRSRASENVIAGNVALYGATSGEVYINGMAGERFAVRNSGAQAVVEGIGEHGCEYMTGGCVVILGRIGENFAAGMSGGVAYVLDEDGSLEEHVNRQLVSVEQVSGKEDVGRLMTLIIRHVRATGSEKGEQILSGIEEYAARFKKVIPYEYKKMVRRTTHYIEQNHTKEEAKLMAFYDHFGS